MQADRLPPRRHHGLVVIGGGVQGVMTALAAARRGLRPLLIERAAFGAATTANSLGIVHGGLRYLQTGNLARHRRSAAACRELLRQFPGLITPLPCLMPLSGRGLARRPVLRAALALHDRLAHQGDGGALPASAVVDADTVRRLVPSLAGEDLHGGACWHEASFDDPAAVIAEALRQACALGATALEEVEAVGLITAAGRVAGVMARHRRGGGEMRLSAPLVINCAGPWTAALARQLDPAAPWLFDTVLACNVILDRPPPALALILKPDRGGALVVRPWRGRTAVGTAYRPWTGGPDQPSPDPATIRRLIDRAANALGDPTLAAARVAALQAGLLPAAAGATPASRDIVHDHGRAGGPQGLFSVAGVKLTTAAALAERVLARATKRIEQGEYGS